MIQFHRCPNLPSKSQDLKNQRNTLHIAACFNVEPQLLEAGKIDQIARRPEARWILMDVQIYISDIPIR